MSGLSRDVPMGGVGGGEAPPKPNSVGKFGLVWTFFGKSSLVGEVRRQILPHHECPTLPVGKSDLFRCARRQI